MRSLTWRASRRRSPSGSESCRRRTRAWRVSHRRNPSRSRSYRTRTSDARRAAQQVSQRCASRRTFLACEPSQLPAGSLVLPQAHLPAVVTTLARLLRPSGRTAARACRGTARNMAAISEQDVCQNVEADEAPQLTVRGQSAMGAARSCSHTAGARDRRRHVHTESGSIKRQRRCQSPARSCNKTPPREAARTVTERGWLRSGGCEVARKGAVPQKCHARAPAAATTSHPPDRTHLERRGQERLRMKNHVICVNIHHYIE